MPTEPSHVLRDGIFKLLTKVDQTVHDATPNETIVSPIYVVILTIYWRCLSRYEAITLLLKYHHIDEALTVMRSLMNDTQRLIYLEKHPQKRNATVMWLWNQRLTNIKNLANTAERTNQPGSQADLLDYVQNQRASIERAKQKYGVTNFLKPPQEGASMAKTLNRLDDWLDYLMTTYASHGTLSSPGIPLQNFCTGDKQIAIKSTDVGMLLGVSERAANYIFESALSVASMLQWESKLKLQTMWNTIQLEFEALKQQVETFD